MKAPFNGLGYGPMIRISLPYVYTLATALESLGNLKAGVKLSEKILGLWTAEHTLRGLMEDSVFSQTLRSSRDLGNALLAALQTQTEKTDWDDELDMADVVSITHAYSQYKIALLAELGVFPSYFVTQKEGYDTLSLLEDGSKLFPSSLTGKAPEALFDVMEAGKALAFELGTACGFHVFRATEAVLRRYYVEVTGGKAEPKVRNIGVYLNSMKQANCGEPRVLAALKQMTDFHRNPLIHPEAVLTMDEAVSILGLARSVIEQMLSELPDLLPTTTATV